MAFKTLSENLEESGAKAQEYIKNTSEYYKLRTFKTVTKGAISLVNFLVLGIFLLLVLLFVSIGVALWLNNVLENSYAGYFIVAGFYIVIMLLLVIFGKKPIEKILLIKFSDMFFDNDDDPEPDVQTQIMNNKDNNQEI
tara:strand:+ start:215204 stop:215620 length:417 start_codon:yes stop_codon:yes gene_type:complete